MVDIETGRTEALAGVFGKNGHTGFLQYGQAGLVNGFDGVLAQQFVWRMLVLQRFPGQLWNQARNARITCAAPAASCCHGIVPVFI